MPESCQSINQFKILWNFFLFSSVVQSNHVGNFRSDWCLIENLGMSTPVTLTALFLELDLSHLSRHYILLNLLMIYAYIMNVLQ